jgi:hypothetical protein
LCAPPRGRVGYIVSTRPITGRSVGAQKKSPAGKLPHQMQKGPGVQPLHPRPNLRCGSKGQTNSPLCTEKFSMMQRPAATEATGGPAIKFRHDPPHLKAATAATGDDYEVALVDSGETVGRVFGAVVSLSIRTHGSGASIRHSREADEKIKHLKTTRTGVASHSVRVACLRSRLDGGTNLAFI